LKPGWSATRRLLRRGRQRAGESHRRDPAEPGRAGGAGVARVPIRNFEDLKGKKIATGRGSIGHQLILAALESRGWSASDVQIVFPAPSDAKVAKVCRCVSTWEPYVSQEEVLFSRGA